MHNSDYYLKDVAKKSPGAISKMTQIEQRLEEFLTVANQFKLGSLPTESRHPKTTQLSSLARHDIPEALKILKNIDLEVLERLMHKKEQIFELSKAMRKCEASGGRIFFVGCGATGRLSLSLETLWRQTHLGNENRANRVYSLMAGGDVALIRSIENFEDHPEFGRQQLLDLGFGANDLLVATTEGGETPFVIGATEAAVEFSRTKPYFMYCNPDNILVDLLDRSRRVILNEKIQKINLYVGPMSLSGSTRLQASTILMLAAGIALFLPDNGTEKDIEDAISNFHKYYENLDVGFLEALIKRESEIYQKGEFTIYQTDEFGITVLTDTTERSPTFSLAPFENCNESQSKPSLCSLKVLKTDGPKSAWRQLLAREPRPLDWPNYQHLASEKVLHGFDFSENIDGLRTKRCGSVPHHTFSVVSGGENHLRMGFRGAEAILPLPVGGLLWKHICIKLLLNMHSTLLMGRLGRYQGNLMTWVRPSNFKLIDRAIRYARSLIEDQGGIPESYEKLARRCFELSENLGVDEPIVLKIVESYGKK